ncbi:carph-isopro domain-containing protein [Azospirillum sp. TSH58]|uniref:carph-isopro domain-containing protein n=1 Tax=Azospirillum sp. TSH58 TaxID=664962 RepID=UPI00352F58C4
MKPTQAERIIAKFATTDVQSGVTQLAETLGHRNRTTVQGWLARGWIPARQQQAVLDAALALGIALAPSDFFELRSEHIRPVACVAGE